jgi:hypothetical protein
MMLGIQPRGELQKAGRRQTLTTTLADQVNSTMMPFSVLQQLGLLLSSPTGDLLRHYHACSTTQAPAAAAHTFTANETK